MPLARAVAGLDRMMMIALYILGGWCALSLIAAPVLVPFLASRFAKHEDWIKEAENSRWRPSVTPQVRMLRRAESGK
jgi:hypothetical protein